MRKPLRLTRILVVMSKSFLHGIILTCLFTSVLLANDGNAQHKSIKEVLVSVALDDATLREMIDVLESKTEFKFIYSGELLSKTNAHRVTLSVDNKSVAYVLQHVASTTGLIFQQNDGAIAIGTGDLKVLEEPKKLTQTVLEQDITGKVTDEEGAPLPGASVLVQGTNIGVITDVDGNYKISVPDEATVLVFSYVGYEQQEVAIGGRAVVDVSLKLDVTTLGEIVVSTGYWEMDKRESTGNISKVTAEEIEKQPIANPLQAIQGRMAGVYVQQTTGVPGGGFNIQIRGQNSLRDGRFGNANGNLPLYIVNGVPFTSTTLNSFVSGNILGDGGSPLNSINPADIESIEVLKDADATAIYGSRGANGVVLITTKRGREGRMKVDVNLYQGVGKVNHMMELLNRDQYLEMRREAFSNDGFTPGLVFPDHDLLSWDTTRHTDWQRELIGGTANVTNAQASISGGSSNTKFLIGAGYYRESTVFPGDFKDQKYSTQFNLNHTALEGKLRIDFTGSYLIDENNLLRSDLTSSALTLPPIAPAPFDDQGNLNWENGTWQNPLSVTQQNIDYRTSNLIANTVVDYQIFKDLQMTTNLGYTELRLEGTQSTPISSINPFTFPGGTPTGSTFFEENGIKTWIVEPQIKYQKTLGNGSLSILIGGSFQENENQGQIISATGYTSDALLLNIQAAPNIDVNEVRNIKYRYNAFFGRVNYNWKGKYIVNLTGRRDGSSRFGPGNQFANFGAFGTAWIFSEEGFVKSFLPYVSFGKLRASYGTTGNDQIGDYGFLDLWNPTKFSYAGSTGLFPNNLFNPDYQWEVNKKLEIALELGFLNDRIFVSTSYYRNRSDNQLIGLPLPTITGFPSIQANLPAEVENTGVEIELNTVNVKSKDFSWSSSFNISIPKNELISYPNIENSAFRDIYEVGKSLFIQKTFLQLGVDQELGIYTFEDKNEDENVSFPDDIQALEEVTQQFYGGFQNSFTFKSLRLDVLLQFVKQQGWSYLSTFSNTPGSQSNQPALVMNRWQTPGDVSDIQKFTQFFLDPYIAYQNTLLSDNAITDASFIRLKNISLSYQLPALWVDKVALQRAEIYVQAQNLLTITDYVGLDPESQLARLPPLRMITGGCKFTF